ncbi:hypothetical protein C8Q76DRAFT_735474 [Earliella scabrosa]|nr:hypothetical protein C8Q76DRAFT_735474 [Earliella scabrosa]
MDRLCGGSHCNPAKRRRVYPRQTPSITPVATAISGTGDARQTDTLATEDTPDLPSGAITSAPSAPTGRQDSGDDDPSNDDPADGPGASDGDGASDGGPGQSQGTSEPPTSDPTESPTSRPTSQDSSKPPTSSPTSQPPTSEPTSDPPTSQPTSEPTSQPPTSEPTSEPPTSDPTSQPTTDPPSEQPTSAPSSDPSSAEPTSPPSQFVTPPANANVTDSFETTITSAIATTVIDGKTSTIFTAIPTTLSGDTVSDSAATKRNIIAGSVGGAAFLILITAIFLFYRRHQSKKLSFFKRLTPKPRTRLLDGEDMDDYDLGPPTRYRDYPASVVSSAHAHSRSVTNTPTPAGPGVSPLSRSFHDASPGPSIMGTPMDPHRAGTPASLPPGAAAPHLLGMRSETGSIFRESVWPPPGQPSVLVDPIVNASNSVDLSRIIDDVMGPSTAGAAVGAAAAGPGRAPPPTSFRAGPGTANASSSSLVGDDPFASLSMLSISQPPSVAHSRETSDAPLLPAAAAASAKPSQSRGYFDASRPRDSREVPGSPMPPPGIGPLFVTNMGPLSPSSTISPGSPPQSFAAQQALGQVTSPTQSSPTGSVQPKNWLERSPKKVSRTSIDQDVTEMSSTGHGVGQAV